MSILRRAPGAVAIGMVAVCLSPLAPAPAGAAVGDPSYAGCISGTPIAGCTTAGPGLFAVDVELSPDGRQLYVLGREPSLRVFDVGAYGSLVPRAVGGCFDDGSAAGCTSTVGFTDFDVWDLSVSADGLSVYASGYTNLVSWTRDPATGSLTPSSCYGPGAGCTPSFTRAAPVYSALVSPDNKHVYVRQSGGLQVFDRNLTTGLLTAKPGTAGCFAEAAATGCTDSFGLVGQGFEMAMSSDGAHLYLTMLSPPGGVSVFNRASDGTLSRYAGADGGCISSDGSSTAANECKVIGDTSGPALENSWAATISPSGKHLFVSGINGTTVFARASDTGKLTKTDCISPTVSTDCEQMNASGGMGVEVTPDGRRAYVGSYDAIGVGVYGFDDTTGSLSRLPGTAGCFSASAATSPNGCTDIPGNTGGNGKAAISADGLNVYFAATGPVHRLALDAGPICAPANATGKAGQPISIQLACTDPNGDPVTGITVSAPGHGQLQALDVAAQRQAFVADKTFVGTLTFTYTATANGVTSPPAGGTITITDGFAGITIRGNRVPLTKAGKAKVRLTCPASEKSGPCAGTLKVKTRGKVLVGGRKKVVVLGSATYRIAAGTTKGVVVTLKPANVTLVKRVGDARKLKLVATVRDTVGNRATVSKQATLTLP